MKRLPAEIKLHIVLALALFQTPSQVADDIREAYGLDLDRQNIQAYDPGTVQGRCLSRKLREVFQEARDAFLKESMGVRIANKKFQLMALDRMSEKAEEAGNFKLAKNLLAQAARLSGR